MADLLNYHSKTGYIYPCAPIRSLKSPASQRSTPLASRIGLSLMQSLTSFSLKGGWNTLLNQPHFASLFLQSIRYYPIVPSMADPLLIFDVLTRYRCEIPTPCRLSLTSLPLSRDVNTLPTSIGPPSSISGEFSQPTATSKLQSLIGVKRRSMFRLQAIAIHQPIYNVKQTDF